MVPKANAPTRQRRSFTAARRRALERLRRDAFFKGLWDNQANEAHCRRVAITPIHPEPRGFLEFPDDPRLATFDASDRKFVAVAIAAGSHPVIVNASDTDWWAARQVLAEHAVTVEFVCPELMEAP